MHAAGRASLGPAEVLRIIDGQLHEVFRSGKLSGPAAPQFATACYGVLDLSRGELCISNAGHLPPLVQRVDGQTFPVWLPAAAPLGLRTGCFTETTIPLASGDTVLLATDGLVEVRGEDLDAGIATLVDTMRRYGSEASLDRLADQILHIMSRRPHYGSDDIALVIARITDRPAWPRLRSSTVDTSGGTVEAS